MSLQRTLRPVVAALSLGILCASTAFGAPTATSNNSDDFKRVTIDAGGASNFSNNSAAYEAHVGVNLFLLSWLSWRNSPFYRTQSGSPSSYGLDSSIAGHHEIGLAPDVTGNGHIGGGYRVTNLSGASAPFVDGGLGARLKGLGATLGVKHVFHSAITQGMADENLFSFDITGAASF